MIQRILWTFSSVIAVLSITAAVFAAPLRGAIFTTNAYGNQVNGNIYQNCCDVYLNGGPPANAPCSAAGLPDGCYVFQVTNPNGKLLLSSDPIEQRRFVVEGGVIVEYLGMPMACMHMLGVGKCQSKEPDNISIQLMPFMQTPNPGGTYKVWVTRCDDYSPGQGKHGFIPSKSKTDNFKCLVMMMPPPGGD